MRLDEKKEAHRKKPSPYEKVGRDVQIYTYNYTERGGWSTRGGGKKTTSCALRSDYIQIYK